MRGQEVLQPLPLKIIVPALEAASLENPESPLIEWWADLLTSSAKGGSMRPYLVELMRQIGSEEACFLETLWNAVMENYPAISHKQLSGVATRMTIRVQFEAIVRRLSNMEREPWNEKTFALISEASTQAILDAEQRGVPIRLSLYPPAGGIIWPTSPILSRMKTALDVSRALNVVEFNNYSEMILSNYGNQFHYEIGLLEFSNLGAEFMTACRPRGPSKVDA
jgi:hypothetical protein